MATSYERYPDAGALVARLSALVAQGFHLEPTTTKSVSCRVPAVVAIKGDDVITLQINAMQEGFYPRATEAFRQAEDWIAAVASSPEGIEVDTTEGGDWEDHGAYYAQVKPEGAFAFGDTPQAAIAALREKLENSARIAK